MASKLVFVPSGGLANRMRAMASAVNLAERTCVPVKIVWFADWGLGAGFKDIFESLYYENVSLREAGLIDKITVDRARSNNLFMPRLYQRARFSDIIEEKQMVELVRSGFDFEAWAKRSGDHYMSSYHKFGTFDDYSGLVRRLFVPKAVIMNTVRSFRNSFADYTVGLHIRRTDNADSIKYSPLEKFKSIMDNEVQNHPDMKFFLATDDETVKQDLCANYPGKIITSDRKAGRNDVSSIRDGIAEMWTLAATQKIYGSFGSSYSEMASVIGNVNLIVVK